jgi:hypothetical protein
MNVWYHRYSLLRTSITRQLLTGSNSTSKTKIADQSVVSGANFYSCSISTTTYSLFYLYLWAKLYQLFLHLVLLVVISVQIHTQHHATCFLIKLFSFSCRPQQPKWLRPLHRVAFDAKAPCWTEDQNPTDHLVQVYYWLRFPVRRR